MGYGIIGIVSIFVRQFLLLNPFEPLGEGIMIGGVLLSPIILNWIAEPILHIISFREVGMFYHSGDEPLVGSFLYLTAYVFNVAVLWGASQLGFHWYTNLLVAVVYIGCLILIDRSVNDL